MNFSGQNKNPRRRNDGHGFQGNSKGSPYAFTFTSTFSVAPKPLAFKAAIRSATLTVLSAVTVVVALEPAFAPTTTLETPLTLLSAACTFGGQPEAHRRPVTSRVTVFDSAATAPTFSGAVVTAGTAMAPAVKAAKAAIIVNVVFIVFFSFWKRNQSLFQPPNVNDSGGIAISFPHSVKTRTNTTETPPPPVTHSTRPDINPSTTFHQAPFLKEFNSHWALLPLSHCSLTRSADLYTSSSV